MLATRMHPHHLIRAALAAAAAAFGLASSAVAEPRHGLSTFGDLRYPAGFDHFDYVNPDAPKGGKIAMIGPGGVTSFDSFNGYVLKGDAAQGLDLLADTLMARAFDEPDAVYGLIAASADVAEDRHSVTFKLRPEARFSDGAPVTADDVVFSLTMLKDKGHPRFALPLRTVTGAEALDPLTVRYTFTGPLVRDLPILVATLPVLSKAYTSGHPFEATLDAPLGSGPYRIADYKAGSFVAYQRREDYWARDLPVNRGRYNFDTVRYEYFRDRTAELQNLFNGTYDFREEFTSKDWATAYDIAPVRDGRILRQTISDDLPSGTQGFFLNTRRAKLADARVRQALDMAFDFEWSNKNLFYGLYQRTVSYFENSDMKAVAPPDGAEFALLEPYRGTLPPEVFGKPYVPPVTDGTGSDERKVLREASALLTAAGYAIKDGKRVDAAGEPLGLEFLIHEEGFVKIIAPFVTRLEKIGVAASIRQVDPAQYEQRTKTFDFDIAVQRYAMALTPGVELRTFFGSESADTTGSFNLAGIKDPVVDALIERATAATSRTELTTAARALDRVLRARHYWVSHWYKAAHNLAFWNRFSWPPVKPKYDRGAPETWWYDSAKAASLVPR